MVSGASAYLLGLERVVAKLVETGGPAFVPTSIVRRPPRFHRSAADAEQNTHRCRSHSLPNSSVAALPARRVAAAPTTRSSRPRSGDAHTSSLLLIPASEDKIATIPRLRKRRTRRSARSATGAPARGSSPSHTRSPARSRPFPPQAQADIVMQVRRRWKRRRRRGGCA
jgi:hypothetical protein